MYECRVIVNIGLSLKCRPGVRSIASLWVPSGSLHQPLSRLRKQAAAAQHARSASHSARAEAPLQQDLYEQRSNLINAKESLNASQLLQAQQYIELLMKQNATMNLTGEIWRSALAGQPVYVYPYFMGTAAANEEEAFQMHVEDSLALLPNLDTVASQQPQNLGIDGRLDIQEFSIIDVGSGGGLPGVIIAIARPNWKVVIVCFLCCSALQAVLGWDTRPYVSMHTRIRASANPLSCSAKFASKHAKLQLHFAAS